MALGRTPERGAESSARPDPGLAPIAPFPAAGRPCTSDGRGLLLLKAGVAGDCIRVLVPLVITDAELEEALGAWEDALSAAL